MMDSTEQTWWVNLSLHRWEVHLNQYIPNGGFLPAALKSLISPVFNSHFTWNKELKHHTHLICQCHLKPHTWSVLLTMVEGEEWRMEKPIILLFKFCKMCTLPFCDSSNSGSSWAEETVQLYRLCRQWRRRLCKQSSGATMTKCPMPRGWFTNLEGGLTLVLHLHASTSNIICRYLVQAPWHKEALIAITNVYSTSSNEEDKWKPCGNLPEVGFNRNLDSWIPNTISFPGNLALQGRGGGRGQYWSSLTLMSPLEVHDQCGHI